MEDIIDQGMVKAGFTQDGLKEETAPATETNTEVNTGTAEVTKDVQASTENKEEPKSDTLDFNIESFNKAIGGESKYESVDQIKELINLSNQYPELKAQLEERERIIREKDETIKEQFNPMSYFANERQFTINQIMKDNPDLNESIITRIATSDLEKLSDKDVLKFNDLISTKGIFDDKIVEMDIEDRYGINVNREDLDDDQLRSLQIKEYRMKKDAEKARDDLQKLLNVEKPEFKDPTVLKQEQEAANMESFNKNKEVWEGFTKNFVEKEFTKFNIEYQDGNEKKTFEFDVDGEFSEAVRKNLPAMAAANNKDLSKEEDVKLLVDQVKKDFLWLRKDKIIKNAIEDTISKMTKEEIDKYQNTSKPKQDEAPKTITDVERKNQEVRAQVLKDFKI